VRYLVEVNSESFPLDHTEPLKEGDPFTHEGKTYSANLITPGGHEYDGIVKATLRGEVGSGGNPTAG
jgi:hypothetical protein